MTRTPTWGLPASGSVAAPPPITALPAAAIELPAMSAGAVPLLPLSCLTPVARRMPSHTDFLYLAMWTWPLPVRPRSGLQCRPTMPNRPAGVPAHAPVPAPASPGTSGLAALRQFWRTAPVDLRWLAVSLPIILVIVLYSTTRSAKRPMVVEAAAPVAQSAKRTESPGAALPQPDRPSSSKPLGRLQEALAARAAVQLMDDFRGGLGAWAGRGGWAHTWSYDPAGFVRTGSLALYAPTQGLTNYKLEFLGQIENRSLGWVYRAQDLDNYYATKIVVSYRGPQPVGTVVRSVVINGRETNRVELPLPLAIQRDTVYRVQVDVDGDSFTTYVQGQVVDHWQDRRIARGGIGFFSNRGEQARLRWVEVTHQVDALGRLCAALAPRSPSQSNGSSK